MKNNMEVKVIKVNSLEELFAALGVDCFLKAKESCTEKEEEITLRNVILSIAKKKKWLPTVVVDWISDLVMYYPAAAFSILLREIAVLYDKKYEDHIENSEEIYSISVTDGRIHKLCKNNIKNYRNFAAFRTIEDAKGACKILRTLLKGMFSNAKGK